MNTTLNKINPVIGIHGLQGSGKTYLTNIISTMILKPNESELLNIKSSFMPIVEDVVRGYKEIGYELDAAQMKQLCLSVSTFGEIYVDDMIWTNEWVRKVSCKHKWIINDGIRTNFNLMGLNSLSEIRPVIIFKLDVPESVRRSRLGNKYRENGGYTEVLLEKPEKLPENFTWVELTEDWTINDIKDAMRKYL